MKDSKYKSRKTPEVVDLTSDEDPDWFDGVGKSGVGKEVIDVDEFEGVGEIERDEFEDLEDIERNELEEPEEIEGNELEDVEDIERNELEDSEVIERNEFEDPEEIDAMNDWLNGGEGEHSWYDDMDRWLDDDGASLRKEIERERGGGQGSSNDPYEVIEVDDVEVTPPHVGPSANVATRRETIVIDDDEEDTDNDGEDTLSDLFSFREREDTPSFRSALSLLE